jgi:hypothetical protein
MKRRDSQWDSYGCEASIQLRRDDRPILEEIHARLGIGSIYDRATANKNRPNDNPQSQWKIGNGRDVSVLVALFERYPLRAKKARDFEIWREAHTIWCGLPRGKRYGGLNEAHLAPLKAQLESGRKYRETPAQSRDTKSEDARLFWLPEQTGAVAA